MRRLTALSCLSALTLLISPLPAEEPSTRTSSSWTPFTIEQLAEYLGLKGGNVTFEFKQPVYLQLKAVQRKDVDSTEEVILNSWSRKPSTKIDLMVMTQDIEPQGTVTGSTRIRIHYTCYDRHVRTDGPGVTATTINDIGAGFGLNIHWPENLESRTHGGAWRNGSMTAQVGEASTLYESYDTNAPEASYFRLTMQFATSRPETE